jgi:hypothetical protein
MNSYRMLLVSGIGLLGSCAQAKEPAFQLNKLEDTAVITQKVDDSQLIVFGKEWDGKKYCNEATLDNPDILEAYTIKTTGYELAILCPGIVDGDENVVSVFSRTRPPQTKRVQPLSSSSRVQDDVLAKAVKALVEPKQRNKVHPR